MNKTAADASKDNLVFLRNTECLSLNCLINLPAEDILAAIPWDVYPYWDMKEQRNLPTYNYFDGAIAVIDGKYHLGNFEKRFLDAAGAIRSRKSKKDRQYNEKTNKTGIMGYGISRHFQQCCS